MAESELQAIRPSEVNYAKTEWREGCLRYLSSVQRDRKEENRHRGRGMSPVCRSGIRHYRLCGKVTPPGRRVNLPTFKEQKR